MTEEQAYRIKEWLDSTSSPTGAWISDRGSYFEQGLALLGEVMPNLFYLANIRRKGPIGGMGTLRYEMEKKVSGFKFQVSSENDLNIREFENLRIKKNNEIKDKGTTINTESETHPRIVLRKEFPFLSELDCPEEFKVMVSDMITAHDNYLKGHSDLYSVANKSNELCFAVSSFTVDNYINNRKCWAELEYYKKTNQILGEHPLFAKRKREAELKAMSVMELATLYRNLPRNIRYYGKLIEDDTDNELTGERLEKKKYFEWELAIVKRLMEIKERKNKPKVVGKREKGKGRTENGERKKENGGRKREIIKDFMETREQKTENSAKVGWISGK